MQEVKKIRLQTQKQFIKMHGSGNSFILIKPENPTSLSFKDYNNMAIKLCDYNFGIGADGILVILPADKSKPTLVNQQNTQQQQQSKYEMKIYNRDGSYAEMCGNGLRCFCACLCYTGLVNKDRFKVQTDAGEKRVQIRRQGNQQKVYRVTVQMGTSDGIQIQNIEQKISHILQNLQIISAQYTVFNIPHITLFLPKMPTEQQIKQYGQLIQKQINANINFITILPQPYPQSDQLYHTDQCVSSIYIRTYERGAGLTLACGTGACVCVIVGMREGKLKGRVRVQTHGGDLQIWMQGMQVMMDGPAEIVAVGHFLC